jgi:hypothetical protein
MGQGTMTGTSGPSRSTSTGGMTSVDEGDKPVLKHRLLDGMQGVRGSNPLSSTLHDTVFLQFSGVASERRLLCWFDPRGSRVSKSSLHGPDAGCLATSTPALAGMPSAMWPGRSWCVAMRWRVVTAPVVVRRSRGVAVAVRLGLPADLGRSSA